MEPKRPTAHSAELDAAVPAAAAAHEDPPRPACRHPLPCGAGPRRKSEGVFLGSGGQGALAGLVGSISARQWHLRWLGPAASGLFLVVVLFQVGWTELAAALARLSPATIGLAVVFFGLGLGVGASRWRRVARLRGLTTTRSEVWRMTLIGHFFNTFLLGPAGGDVAKSAWFGARWKKPVPDLLAASFLDRLAAGGGSLLLGGLTLAWAGTSHVSRLWRQTAWPSPPWWLGPLALLGVLAGWLLFRYGRISLIRKTLDSIVAGFRAMRRKPGAAAGGVVCGFISQVLFSSVMAILLADLATGRIDWIQAGWIFPLISFLTAMPVSVAGVGVREGSGLLLLRPLGIASGDVIAAGLVTWFIYLAWAGGGGILFWKASRSASSAGTPPSAG